MRSDTIIKILSLGIGLAVGIVLIAKICFETSYESFYKDIDRIYLIQTKAKWPTSEDYSEFGQISGAVAPTFKKEIPGVEESTFYSWMDFGLILDEKGEKYGAQGMMVSEDFFKLFSRPILSGGNPEEILKDPSNVMVSKSLAELLGGVEEVIDKPIKFENVSRNFFVKGVYEDFPSNGQFQFDFVGSIYLTDKETLDNWIGADRFFGYVKLEEGIEPGSLDYAIRKMQETHQDIESLEEKGISMFYTLKPLSLIHTSDPKVKSTIIFLTIIAVLIIVISLLNYILIVISSMVKRSKEIGIRKCYGAGTPEIYRMLSREGLLHLACSLVLAALLIFAGKGLIQDLFGLPFSTLLVWQSLVVIILLIVIVLAVSIVVPAKIYLSIPVYKALKNYTDRSKGWKLGLLGVQVVVNIFLITMIFILSAQYKYMSTANPGYNYDNVYYFRFWGKPEDQLRVVKELESYSFVDRVEASASLMLYTSSGDNVRFPNDDKDLFNVADQFGATQGFYDFFEIPFIDGRAPVQKNEIAVSESFVEKMKDFADWSDGAVGKQIYVTSYSDPAGATISGVYPDMILGSFVRYDQRPSVRYLEVLGDSGNVLGLQYFYVKVSEPTENTITELSQIISRQLDGKEIPVYSYAESYKNAYADSKNMRNTIFIGAIVSVIIALLGLMGFARDEAQRRRKEMAVRKINGAETKEVLGLFTRSVVKLSLISAIFAIVGVILVSGHWLDQFAVKIEISPIYFLYSIAIVIAIVTLVVVLNCWRVANANPVNYLHNE